MLLASGPTRGLELVAFLFFMEALVLCFVVSKGYSGRAEVPRLLFSTGSVQWHLSPGHGAARGEPPAPQTASDCALMEGAGSLSYTMFSNELHGLELFLQQDKRMLIQSFTELPITVQQPITCQDFLLFLPK